ncbi:MAG: endonuclease III domain-containing protein [Candidatus Nanoarchaeia archaeon]
MSDKFINKVLDALKSEYEDSTMLSSFTDKSPFQILIATVLSARSRDEQTIKVVEKLFLKYPDAFSMAKAPVKDLERLVKGSGFYKIKAGRIKEIAKILVKKYKGVVPDDFSELLSLPGVGRKTAGCVLIYAFNKGAIPVDTHVHRVSNRLGWVDTNFPEKTEDELVKLVPFKYWLFVNELFVLHGQNVCKPITPVCSNCVISKYCPKKNVIKYK